MLNCRSDSKYHDMYHALFAAAVELAHSKCVRWSNINIRTTTIIVACATFILRNSHMHVMLMCILNQLRHRFFFSIQCIVYIGPMTDKARKTHQFTIFPCNFHCHWCCSLYPKHKEKIAIKVRLSASEWNRSDLIFANRLPEINFRRYTWRCFHLYTILFCKLNGIVSRRYTFEWVYCSF